MQNKDLKRETPKITTVIIWKEFILQLFLRRPDAEFIGIINYIYDVLNMFDNSIRTCWIYKQCSG